MFRFSDRKHRYLCSTTIEADDGMEVGAGFTEAAQRMSGDDNRPKPAETPPAPVPEDKGGDEDQGDEDQGDDQGGDDQGDDQGGDDQGDDDDEKPAKGTAKYIRELRKERREDRQRIAELEARIAGNSNPPLTPAIPNVTPAPTRPAPDPTDSTKYPLGVLDDRYIEDKIDWSAEQKVAGAIAGQRQTEMAQAQQQAETERLTAVRAKVDDLLDKGTDLFPDYEETVLEAGLAGKYVLTETTFTAASESDHGAEILYNLSKDKVEAARVASLTPTQQIKYVIEQEAKIAEKRQARRKPQAGDPPSSAPRGRNASSPIREDTENLNDFRKLWYKKA